MKKFGAAGFNSCGKDLRIIVGDIDGVYPQKGDNLRMLYLMYEGLANARIVIPNGEFDMIGEYADGSDIIRFQRDIHGPYELEENSWSYFDRKINLRKMRLYQCTDYLPDGPDGSVYEAVRNLRRKIFQRVGSVWHAQWLYAHQEFIPDAWKQIILEGRYIVFPGVELVSKGYPESRDLDIRYPVLHKPRGYVGNITLSFFRSGDFCISKVNHFIVTVGPNFEKVFLSKKLGLMRKTRRYR